MNQRERFLATVETDASRQHRKGASRKEVFARVDALTRDRQETEKIVRRVYTVDALETRP